MNGAARQHSCRKTQGVRTGRQNFLRVGRDPLPKVLPIPGSYIVHRLCWRRLVAGVLM